MRRPPGLDRGAVVCPRAVTAAAWASCRHSRGVSAPVATGSAPGPVTPIDGVCRPARERGRQHCSYGVVVGVGVVGFFVFVEVGFGVVGVVDGVAAGGGVVIAFLTIERTRS